MRLKRKLVFEVRSDRRRQKCLALAILLKHILPHSKMPHFSINKIACLTGASFRAAKSYLGLMENMKLIHFEGSMKDRVLVVGKLSSHTTGRNVAIDLFDFSSLKSILVSLRSLIVMRIQASKEFFRQLLQSRHNPKKSKGFKAAVRKVRDYVREGKIDSVDSHYKEYGVTLERFAKEIGCCVRTAQRIVNHAVGMGWMRRKHHVEQVYAPKVNFRRIDGYTFSTRNNLYIVHANTYSLSPPALSAFFLPLSDCCGEG